MSYARAQQLTIVIGVALSTALGVFFYVKTDLSTAMGTFGGLIGTVITLQIESIFRERREREETTRQQRLVERVEQIGWMPGLLDEALGAVGHVERTYGGTMAVSLVRKAFDDCLAQLRDLQRGRYFTVDDDNSPNSPVRALTERLQSRLLATSAGEDITWWLRPSSNQSVYWPLNEQALQRGVEIKRIFIYREWSDELEALARRQTENGVKVLRVVQDLLPSPLRINLTIWDDTCGFELHHNSAGEVAGQSFTFADQDLALMLDRFKLIESCAELWSDA